MAGRGRSDAHHDAGGGSAIPVIGLDYGYLVKFEDVSAGESPSPILATKCSVAKRVTADVLPCKGVGHPCCVQALVRVLLDAGHAKIILRSDDEPAIVALRERAIAVAKVQHKIDVLLETASLRFPEQWAGGACGQGRQARGPVAALRTGEDARRRHL